MIAVSQVLMSKKSSSGCASKSTPARNPPSRAPTTPMIAVTMIPPGSSPGSSALAIAPAISPRMMNAMMPMKPPSDLLRTTPCGSAAGVDSRLPGAKTGSVGPLVAARPGDRPALHEFSVEDEEHRRPDDRGDEASDERARDAEENRLPPRHRIRAGHGEASERADDQAGHGHGDDHHEHEATLQAQGRQPFREGRHAQDRHDVRRARRLSERTLLRLLRPRGERLARLQPLLDEPPPRLVGECLPGARAADSARAQRFAVDDRPSAV